MRGPKKEKLKDTNLGIVRLKKGGMRFEVQVARDQYPSAAERKVKGFEWNVDAVLMTPAVFTNAAKNEIAKPGDIAKAFDGLKEKEVLAAILAKGDLQLSDEDRNAIMAEEAQKFEALCSVVDNKLFVRPTEEVLSKKKVRLDKVGVPVIDRELKNIRFKPNPELSIEKNAADAVAALRAMSITISVLRDQRRVTLTALQEPGKAAAKLKLLENDFQGFVKVLEAVGEDVTVVVDPDAIKPVCTALGCPTPKLDPQPYIPTSDEDDLTVCTVTTLGSTPGTSVAGDSKTKKDKKKDKKGEPSERKAEPTGGPKIKSLEQELAELQVGEDSEDDKKGKKGKKGKKAKGGPAPAPAKPAPSKKGPHVHSDEEEGGSEPSASGSDSDSAPTTMKPKKGKKGKK